MNPRRAALRGRNPRARLPAAFAAIVAALRSLRRAPDSAGSPRASQSRTNGTVSRRCAASDSMSSASSMRQSVAKSRGARRVRKPSVSSGSSSPRRSARRLQRRRPAPIPRAARGGALRMRRGARRGPAAGSAVAAGARRRRQREPPAALGDAVVEREERRFPGRIARDRIDVVERDQVEPLEAFERARGPPRARLPSGSQAVGAPGAPACAQAACSRWLLPLPGWPVDPHRRASTRRRRAAGALRRPRHSRPRQRSRSAAKRRAGRRAAAGALESGARGAAAADGDRLADVGQRRSRRRSRRS